MIFACFFAFVFHAFSSRCFELILMKFIVFLIPRANGRHAKFATPPIRKPIFSSCALLASHSKLHGKPLGITVAITEPECTSGRHGCNHRTRVHFRAPRVHSRQALCTHGRRLLSLALACPRFPFPCCPGDGKRASPRGVVVGKRSD